MNESRSSVYARIGRLSAIMMILPSAMAAGWVLGYYVIDRLLGSAPWGGLIMVFVGAGAGFFEIFRILTQDPSAEAKGK